MSQWTALDRQIGEEPYYIRFDPHPYYSGWSATSRILAKNGAFRESSSAYYCCGFYRPLWLIDISAVPLSLQDFILHTHCYTEYKMGYLFGVLDHCWVGARNCIAKRECVIYERNKLGHYLCTLNHSGSNNVYFSRVYHVRSCSIENLKVLIG